MNYVQKRILVVGLIVFSVGLLIVPWTSPHEILVRGARRTSAAHPATFSSLSFPNSPPRYGDPEPPVFASSGYCLIFAMPQGASIAWGRMWPPLAVVVMGTALGLYLAHGQDQRTPFYGKPPSS